MSDSSLALLLGLGIGAVIGATVLLTNFCALGGVADILFARDWRRMRAWMLAGGIAILGTQALDGIGILRLDETPYADTHIFWLPVLIGGVCFGFGMALAGGCVNRALTRAGAGSLKSLITVLIVGLVAALTMNGFLRPAWDSLQRHGALALPVPANLHHVIGAAFHINSNVARATLTILIGGGLVFFCLKDAWFRASRDHLMAGLIVGFAVILAWAVSGLFATHAHMETAINFVAPAGDLLAAFGGIRPPTAFPVAIVIGVPLGAFIAGIFTRNLAREMFTDRADTIRHVIGGVLMGFGGTLSLGCTFGQGLTGLSALSLNAFLAILGFWFGCLWGIRTFEAESIWGGLKLTLRRRAL